MKIRLVPASAHPELLGIPLQWSLDLWGEGKEEFSKDDWINFYQRVQNSEYESWDFESLDKELLFLAMPSDSNEVIGVIGLCDFDDLEEFVHLKPWICAFIVRADLRGKGIGKQIISEIERLAKSYGIEKVHLWTEDQVGFYLKLGYNKIDELKKSNRHIDVMSKSLIYVSGEVSDIKTVT